MHHYEDRYEQHLRPIRKDLRNILEIGVGGGNAPNSGGESLWMWQDYFPHARLYGLDIYDKHHLDNNRIHTFIIDQSNTDSLSEFARKHGPFDLIIDDGSHRGVDITAALRVLYPYLKDDCYYVIEDIQTSYWGDFGGSSIAYNVPETATNLLKHLIDIIHSGEMTCEDTPAKQTGWAVSELHVYHNIAFIKKTATVAPSRVLNQEYAAHQRMMDEKNNRGLEVANQHWGQDAVFRHDVLSKSCQNGG
ncbi:MAG TPA: hypothetical protein DIS76_06475 [Rhodospirillaceae bacterium]|nr:hypothetical protein [Rhodospirillaceae bacterium]